MYSVPYSLIQALCAPKQTPCSQISLLHLFVLSRQKYDDCILNSLSNLEHAGIFWAIVSEIMYSVFCCASLEILRYTSEEQKEIKYREIRSLMQTGQPLGLTKFIDLRSLYSKLRPLEAKIPTFRACEHYRHGICGITDGVKVSGKQIGSVVRRLQSRI